jgi:short-subunit dehydrogenase
MTKWAIITGASSGIGRALSFEFAAGNFNVVLIGRSQNALADVAKECRERYRVETEIFVADLACGDSVQKLVAELASKPREYEVLVNNAGFGIHGDFASADVDQNIGLLNVQLTAMLQLTNGILPGMISRHRGRILNVASVYSFSPVPFQSVYGACKAFLLSFSSAIRSELKETGVSVTVLCPGTTQTQFRVRGGIGQKHEDAGMLPEEVARIGYRATIRGQEVAVPGFLNRVFVVTARLLPMRFVPGLVKFINRRRGQQH